MAASFSERSSVIDGITLFFTKSLSFCRMNRRLSCDVISGAGCRFLGFLAFVDSCLLGMGIMLAKENLTSDVESGMVKKNIFVEWGGMERYKKFTGGFRAG